MHNRLRLGGTSFYRGGKLMSRERESDLREMRGSSLAGLVLELWSLPKHLHNGGS